MNGWSPPAPRYAVATDHLPYLWVKGVSPQPSLTFPLCTSNGGIGTYRKSYGMMGGIHLVLPTFPGIFSLSVAHLVKLSCRSNNPIHQPSQNQASRGALDPLFSTVANVLLCPTNTIGHHALGILTNTAGGDVNLQCYAWAFRQTLGLVITSRHPRHRCQLALIFDNIRHVLCSSSGLALPLHCVA